MSEAQQSREPQRDTAEESQRDAGQESGTKGGSASGPKAEPKSAAEAGARSGVATGKEPGGEPGKASEPGAEKTSGASAGSGVADAASDAPLPKGDAEPGTAKSAARTAGTDGNAPSGSEAAGEMPSERAASDARSGTGTSDEGESDTAASGVAGSGAAGSGAAASGVAGSDTAGSGVAGSDTAGSGVAGSDTAGSGAAGSDTAGSGAAGSGAAASGAESGVAKSDTAKSGAAESDTAKADTAKADTAKSGAAASGAESGAESGPAESSAADPAGSGASAGRAVKSEAGAGSATSGSASAAAKNQAAADASAASRAGQPAAKGAAGAKASGRDTEGRLLAGRYRLGGVLGRGGMGTVWRAVDETLGRTVAVKELRFPNSIDEEEKRRLITRTLREAKAIARIRNNSAVTVFDVVDEDDRPWIVMELVEGKSLAEAIREDGTLTPRRAAEVGLAILDVLRSAHRQGILHRDVKPSNVLIAKDDGRVVLTDFGIAQVEGDPSITSTGMLVGAPSYISPERARGHKPGPAADLWSLGGLLYASVEGCPPYDKGSAIATLTAVMTEPLDPPKNAGPLEEVIYGLLVKDPDQRLDDVGARALLTGVLHAPEAPAEPEPSPEATRVVALPPLPPALPEARQKDPAADRMRGSLRSVRNAAAAAKPEPKPQSAPRSPSARPMRARALLTDVVPRHTLVIIAVVAALAVLTTGLYLTLGGGDEGGEGGENKTKSDKTASAGATSGNSGGKGTDAGQGTGGDKTKGTGKDVPKDDNGSGAGQGGKPSGKPKVDDSTGGGAVPAGYALISNDQFHFSMAMPKGFHLTGIAGQNSGGIFSLNGGFPRVQVDFNASPKDDAAAAWAAAVAVTQASSDGYKHLGIGQVEYNGYPTVADWQFERNQGGERVRILNRGFKVDAKRGYSIMISCKASEWDGAECATLRKTAFATFKPKD